MKSGLPGFLLYAACTLPAWAQTDAMIQNLSREYDRHWGYLSVSYNPQWTPVSDADAAQLEMQLKADPEASGARIKLLNYYYRNQLRVQRAELVYWLITHHPESPILGLDLAWISETAPRDYERAAALWDAALAHFPLAPETLHNAARFFEVNDPARSAELATRLKQLDAGGHGKLVHHYFQVIAPAIHPERAGR